ncbi:MAG: flagellar biosynthetic protein FliR [Syntrophaceae bacterium]|nr:flagellar biosynthetic protein FliR [Syntrophaceae bacterium]
MLMPVFSAEYAQAFVLVLLRVSTIIVMMPILGHKTVPVRVKAGLSLIISFLIFPFVRQTIPAISPNLIPMIFQMAGEVMIGLILGFAVKIVFTGIQYAGELIGLQMGFSMANVLDPVNNINVSIISEMQYLMALLIFLSINGHHVFITAITDSYRILQPLGFHISGPLTQAILLYAKEIFVIAVKAAAPIIAVMLFANLGMALIARTVPQINILIVGFPLQIAVGLIFLGLTMPIFLKVIETYFVSLEGQMNTLMKLM